MNTDTVLRLYVSLISFHELLAPNKQKDLGIQDRTCSGQPWFELAEILQVKQIEPFHEN